MITARAGVPIARSHKPKILHIPNLSSGGYLVSFAKDCPSFSSFGLEMGRNAPISEEVASSYVLALQSLLDSENHSLRIGPMVVCFWTRQSDFSPAKILARPDPKSVADFLKAPWAGVDRNLAKQDQFYSVTLSGNAGRVVVRHWMQRTVEQAIENLHQWFNDLEMVEIRSLTERESRKRRGSDTAEASAEGEGEKMSSLAIFRLACATVREAKDLQAEVPAQLYRAALEGTTPSPMLLKLILQELRSAVMQDSRERPRFPFNPSRFALLKLILNRNKKEGEPMIEPRVFETDDPAYNCGRLLAVLGEVQAKAHEYALEGAGVAERYFGTASVSPSSVFPILLRLNRHHLDKIGKSDKYASHRKPLEETIQMILCKFQPAGACQPPQFPRHLDLHAQGRFAIGFYQQKADMDIRKYEAKKDREKQSQGQPGQ